MTYDASVERVLNATVDEVFDAYSSVAARRVWMARGEDGLYPYLDISGDPVPGGAWSTAWGASEDQVSHEFGVYEIVDRPHRIVTPATFRAPDGRTMRSELELTFEDQAGRTRLVIRQRGIPTEQVRDFVTAVAWPGVLDNLEWYLTDR